MFNLANLPLYANLLLFVAAGGAVWIAGIRLTIYADMLSERTGLGREIMGFVFLAAATELPEIVTNSVGALRGNGALVVNGMFGGIAMQTAVLILADLAVLQYTLTYAAYRSVNMLQGVMLIMLLASVLAVSSLGDIAVLPHLGLGSVLVAIAYLVVIWVLWVYQGHNQWRALSHPEEAREARKEKMEAKTGGQPRLVPMSKLLSRAAFASLVILVAGVLLVFAAETIADQSGLGSSFIGATLLASSTSLPEVSTTIQAVRLGAHSMAISNIFGSNLIMVFLLLPTDLLYRQGLILNQIDPMASFALLSGIVVTGIYLTGLLIRRNKNWLGLGIDSWLVLIVYIGSVLAFYHLR